MVVAHSMLSYSSTSQLGWELEEMQWAREAVPSLVLRGRGLARRR